MTVRPGRFGRKMGSMSSTAFKNLDIAEQRLVSIDSVLGRVARDLIHRIRELTIEMSAFKELDERTAERAPSLREIPGVRGPVICGVHRRGRRNQALQIAARARSPKRARGTRFCAPQLTRGFLPRVGPACQAQGVQWSPDQPVPSGVADAVAVTVDGGCVIYHAGTDQVILLNATGGSIWQRLGRNGLVADLVADLADSFGKSAEVIERDVARLLEDLEQHGLLARTGAAGDLASSLVSGRKLVDPPNPCGKPASLEPWASGFTVDVGVVDIGVRTTIGLDQGLRQALAPITVDDHSEAVSLSLRRAEKEGGFHLLFWGGCPAVRTRDPARLSGSFLAHLGCHQEPGGSLRTFQTAVQRADGGIVIFPPIRGAIPTVEQRLRSAGAIVSDWPYSDIHIDDDGAVSLLVGDPELPSQVCEGVTDLFTGLPRLAEEKRIAVGRHPVVRLAQGLDRSAAEAVYATFAQLPRRSAAALESVARLVDAVPRTDFDGEPAVTVAAVLDEG